MVSFLGLKPRLMYQLFSPRKFNRLRVCNLILFFLIFEIYVLYDARLPVTHLCNVNDINVISTYFRIYLLLPAGRNPMDARLGAIGGANTA